MRTNINRLLDIMARLRDPEGGCPWDLEQNFATIAPYTIEEAYEVADAIDAGDMAALKGELGDLLLQVVYHAQMASEAGDFNFAQVVAAICDKMVARHPHVFGDSEIADARAQSAAWEEQKSAERARRATDNGDGAPSQMDGVARGMPALLRAMKLQQRAARIGFDWPDAGGALAKIEEEFAELKSEIAAAAPGAGPAGGNLELELGDLLFSVVNAARKLGLDPETALRRGNAKFERRFRRLEAGLGRAGKTLEGASLDELEDHWRRAKAGDGETGAGA